MLRLIAREHPVIRIASILAWLGLCLATPGSAADPLTPPLGTYAPWGFDLSGLDRAGRPGDDFFRYGNGAWADSTAIPADLPLIGIDRMLEDEAQIRIRSVLEESPGPQTAEATVDGGKVRALYASFMDEARREALDGQPIAAPLQHIREASGDGPVELMGRSYEGLLATLFTIAIGPDAKAPDRYVVTIGQSGLGLPDRDYYLTPSFAAKKEAYRSYIAESLARVGWEAPEQAASDILAFETAIAEASWSATEQRDTEKTYNPTSLADLAEAAPFPWRALLTSAGLGRVDRVVVAEVSALPRLAAIYARTPVATVRGWHAFHLVDSSALYLSKRFVAGHFAFRSGILGGVVDMPARWKLGVDLVNALMGEGVGRIYVARWFPAEAKAAVQVLVADLRAAFAARLDKLPWMRPQTKTRALEKLARIRVKIAYPERWRDYSRLEIRADDLLANVRGSRAFEWLRYVARIDDPVDRDEWDMTPQTANAYYSFNFNEIVFPAAELQAPYFHPSADPAVNYGGIGAIIGHEITHGFDDQGRKFDAGGVLTSWWMQADVQSFEAAAAELGRQYDAVEIFPAPSSTAA